MYLKNIYQIVILVIILSEYRADRNPDLITRTGVDRTTLCGVGLSFYVELNNTSEMKDYEVQLSADQCCLEAEDSIDCDVLEILGDCVGIVPKGTIRTVRMVAPLLDPLERHGHCIVYLDSKSSNDGRNMRDTIKINFDTRINNIKDTIEDHVKHCKAIDEDPLNDCKPVDCDSYYNGKKPHYSRKLKRCVETPPCISEIELDIPNTIYDPILNLCIDGKSVNKRDVDNIKKLHNNTNDRKVKDVLIIKKFRDNVDNVTNFNLNDAIDRVPMCKECKKLHVLETAPVSHVRKECYNNLYSYVTTSRYTQLIFVGVILVQCCMIMAMVYCFSRNCACKEKKVVRKFFNYRQDASVTTPLIATSNMDTETTEYQFQESNVDQKIKCYKACQKERNNVKLSLSDDILAKCVNRRNWSRCLTKSEAIPEVRNESNATAKDTDAKIQAINEATVTDTQITFEDERPRIEKKSKQVGSLHIGQDIVVREKDNIEQFDSSEREIQCHSYNFEANSNITGFQPSVSKNLGYLETQKCKRSVSTEKGAQAYFSNDSIDDMLSERGIYLAENISKFTLSTDSTSKRSTPVSSKTSKNFVKSLMTLIHKKSKASSSDPGPKPKDSLDIKLIHMSLASLQSSNSECPKCKPPQESRTSL